MKYLDLDWEKLKGEKELEKNLRGLDQNLGLNLELELKKAHLEKLITFPKINTLFMIEVTFQDQDS